MVGITQKSSAAAFPLDPLGKKKKKQHKWCYMDFYCLLACSFKMRNLKEEKENKIIN